MIELYGWAKNWGVPFEAVVELQRIMGTDSTNISPVGDVTSEATATKAVRLQIAQAGGLAFRNNVGAMQDDDGRVIRYGLANESKQMNKKIKSSDLIGITPFNILPHHVGMTVGRFTAIEMKEPGWVFAGTEREKAQLKFLELIISKGGIGKFSTGEM